MKKGNCLLIVVIPLLILSTIRCTYYQNPGEPPYIEPIPDPAYIGSARCEACHQDIHSTFINSGHPYVHSKVENGEAPIYPFTSLNYLPPYFANGWNDVTYTIGGFAWKYNMTDVNGYIYTGDDAQYNFQDESAAAFHAGEDPGTKKFDCGKCHTTGWVSVADGGSPHEDLPGMDGDFALAGVQCEACHGMGSVHAFTKSADDIEVITNSTLCAQCHYRNEDHTIAAADGFILHNAQFDEMNAADHITVGCGGCHDPHVSVKHDQSGIIKDCIECHTDMKNPTHNGADCITCHMSYATKSAVVTNKYVADVKTHIFKINPTEDGEMFNEDGTIANGETGVTLGYVCYQCHRDDGGVGGTNSIKTLKQLSAKATNYHD